MGNSESREKKQNEEEKSESNLVQDSSGPPEISSVWDHFKMARYAYDQLVNAIIRPPRVRYPTRYLGLNEFLFLNQRFVRNDFELVNLRGQALKCSHWEPVERPNEMLPCVVYLHGNSSNRLESLGELSVVLSTGATMFAFDFSGSGNSEGEYVSLGYFEKDDLYVVLDYLRSSGKTSTIGLWGRSMGAATAIMYVSRDSMIDAMIIDSSFTSLSNIAEDLINRVRRDGTTIPKFIEYVIFKMVRQSVSKIARFDIEQLRPNDYVPSCFVPALFCAGDKDDFILPQHTITLFERYGSREKELVLENGNHNSPRSVRFKAKVQDFLHTHLLISTPLISIETFSEDDSMDQLPWLISPINDSIGITEQRQKEIEEIMTNLVKGDTKP